MDRTGGIIEVATKLMCDFHKRTLEYLFLFLRVFQFCSLHELKFIYLTGEDKLYGS